MLSREQESPHQMGYLSRAYLAGDEDVLSRHTRGFQGVCNLALILHARNNTFKGKL